MDASDGTVLTGLADGRIQRVDPEVGSVTTVADTSGRPLGLEWFPDGRLLVCDARRGLLAIDLADGAVEMLASEAAGRPIVFCNNAAVSEDGTVWFSDSSARFGIDVWKADILEHGGTGRLLRRTPGGEIDEVATGLNFPNGVALSEHGETGFVVETGSYTLSRFDTSNPVGDLSPLVTNLPGFPDNIALGTDGLLWVTLATPRNPAVDALAPLPGVLRRAVWALPDAVQPQPARQIWVVAVDPNSGTVVHDLQGEHPHFGMTTGVREHEGTVWLGSLVGTTVAAFRLAPTTARQS